MQLRDELTPASHSFLCSTRRVPLFLDSTHERRQFFRLVERMGMEEPMGHLAAIELHANRAGH